MNTGQMLLTIGALLLLSSVMLRVNSNNFSTESVRDEARFGVIATSIATSIIERAKSFAFDANTDSNSVTSLSELTSVFNLGPDAGENSADIKTFNDFDDLDGYTAIDSTLPTAIFDVSCSVDYVSKTNLMGVSSSPTWHKKISVTVSSPSMDDTLTEASICSYWFFR
jgi:MSHA pilin protein MshD